jgi:murein DD-endopeptidase MepM/ murein hydrolase activator NlpD
MTRTWLVIALVMIAALWPRAALKTAPGSRLFPETGWQVGGRLLEYWDANGGLPVFGLPIGPQRTEQINGETIEVQPFERARLELHPNNQPPYDVLLGRLGADALQKSGRDWHAEHAASAFGGPCQTFETGHNICGPFLTYWQRHGLDLGDSGASARESLALFGLPLTDAHAEMASNGASLITQWFERARFEFHPDNPEPYNVLLGRLGAEIDGEPAGLPRPSVQVTTGTTVAQGHMLEVTAQFSQTVTGMLGSAPLPFVQTANGWRAFSAVSAIQPPGALPLTVQATLPDGRIAATSVSITVVSAGYPVDYIALPADVQAALNNNEAALAQERAEVNAVWAETTPERLWQGRWQLPAQGRLSSPFGAGRSYDGGPVDSFHEGMDIANVNGTPIYAPARGRVALAKTGYVARGGAVIIDHGWGVHSGYWHMDEVLVHPGQMVEAGQLIGRMGAQGMVTGPHLHWEVHVGMISTDPQQWLDRDWP